MLRVVIILRRKIYVHNSFKLNFFFKLFFYCEELIREGSGHESKIYKGIIRNDYANRSTAHVGRIIYNNIILRDTSLPFPFLDNCNKFKTSSFFLRCLAENQVLIKRKLRDCEIVPAIKFQDN